MKVIVINGQGGVGKDEFIRQGAINDTINIRSLSTIDYVKEQARKLGWTGTKEDRDRRFLSDLKDALTRYNDSPFEDIIRRISYIIDDYKDYPEDFEKLIVFIHCREPEEIDRFCKELSANSLLIRRESVEHSHGNHADDMVFNYDYDYVYNNDHDLETLHKDAKGFIEFLRNMKWTSCNNIVEKVWSDEYFTLKDLITTEAFFKLP